MPHHFVHRLRTLSVLALSAAVIALLSTMMSFARARNEGHASEDPRAAASSQTHPSLAPGKSGSVGVRADAPLFQPAVPYSTGGSDVNFYDVPTWVTTGDLNGDGKLDIIVTNWCSSFHGDETCPDGGSVGVLLGNGDGTFQPVVTYASGGYYAFSVFLADVNQDGKPDLVVANGCAVGSPGSCSDSGSVGVLIGNGDGTFQAVRNYASGGLLSWMAVADVNGDGKPDILVANRDGGSDGQGSVGVLLGTGTGTFEPVQIYTSGGLTPSFLGVADLNSDGNLDLLVSNPASCNNCPGNIGVLLGNGNGTFQPVVNYDSTFGVNVIVVADLNNDGKLDLVVNAGGSFDGGEIAVLLGNGDGTFQPSAYYSSGGGYNNPPVVIDLNGDHKLDLAVGNGQFCANKDNSGCIGVLLGNGDGTFQPAVQYPMSGAGQLVAGDVNGDGKTDLLTVSQCNSGGCKSGSVEVLLGNGDGTFQPALSFGSGGNSTVWIDTVDVNGDGSLDVIAVNANGDGNNGAVGILINNTAALPSTATTLASSLNPSTYGQAVTFTATVSSASGTPTGTVIFYDSSTAIGSATLASGSAAISTSSLSAGSHSITAAYQGSGGFAPSTSSALTQVVNSTNIATTTTIATSKNPGIYQQPVTFTATVTSASGTPTGTVVFYEDTKHIMGSATLVNGIASFTISSLKRDKYAITAAYQGSGNFQPSTSPVLEEWINYSGLFQTHTVERSSGSPSLVGQPVTFTAYVRSRYGPIPDGDSVVFATGEGLLLGTGITQNGSASITTSSLRAGVLTIFAYYEGDYDFHSSYTHQIQTVDKDPTSTTVTASPNPAVYGQAVTYTATVTSAYGTPTGDVRISDLGLVPLVNGVATITKNLVRAGTHDITASYQSDSHFARSTSPVYKEVVTPASTTTVLTSSANPSSSGQTVIFTATVTSSAGVNPFGTVTFTAGGTTLGTVVLSDGVASVSTASLAVGSTLITATYNGADSFTGSSASLTQVVQ